ncbi:hypothetical protein [Sideroxydans sp. CL21]|nr:hypothetical protein [Sideroxydans sp. CL21]
MKFKLKPDRIWWLIWNCDDRFKSTEADRQEYFKEGSLLGLSERR